MSYAKAELLPRFLASLVDGVIAGVFSVIPFVGALVGAVYLLLKDALLYELTKQEEWRNRSIGKKLLSLQVVRLDGETVDLLLSAKRNLPLAVGSLLAVIPLLGWVAGSVLGLILGIVECVLVLTDPAGRRLGDRWANTQVVAVAPAAVTPSPPAQ